MTESTPTARGRLLPHPILSVLLFVVWLMLYKSLSPATIVGGAFLGFAIPFFTRRFWPERPKVRDWGALIRFVPVFVWDVLRANIQVAWLIVNVPRKLRPRWIVIPLDISDPHAIVMLANVISLTPGTVSSEVGPDRRTLLVHSLDVADEAEAIAFIKRRYEAPIGKMFP
jgi:multicomponent K+:H+ antiporter subunit E